MENPDDVVGEKGGVFPKGEVVPEEAIEANRGQKYIRQGQKGKTIWWSMPSVSQKAKCEVLNNNRSTSTAWSKEIFMDKESAFKRL